MLSEEKIIKELESRYRLFIRTGKDKFLYQAEILEDVLELDLKTKDGIFKRISEEQEKKEV